MAAKSISCVIKYDNNVDGIYYSGDLLSGTVTLTLTKTKTVRGISLTVLGHAESEWTTGTGNSRRTHSGKEDYLKSISYLLGERNGPDIEIYPGVYNYTFSCVLPPLLPTSFEHDIGSIKYTVTVNLDRPFKFDDTFTVLFTILKRVDLNFESPGLRLPLTVSENKSMYFCCIPVATFNTNASIPQQGYVPGQAIDVEVYIDGAKENIYSLKIKLKKVLTFFSDGGSKEIKTENLSGVELTTISSHMRTTLLVPCVPPTLDALSKIVHVTYQIVVTVCVSGPHMNPKLILPITVGTIPFVNIGDEIATAIPSPSAPLINHSYQTYNQTDDPPTYNDSMNFNEKK